jgi:adenylate kinase
MIILMGIAGAGKSTQGRLLADEYGLAWISTGELLRVLVTGRRRQEMLQGKLLSDDEMIYTLDKIFGLINTSEAFVLDGFPRTLPQAEWLLEQAQHGRFDIDVVFNLTATPEVLHPRLRNRGRLDDTDEAIARRFEEYQQITRPIIALFQARQLPVREIDASRSPQAVHDDLLKHLQSLQLIGPA